MSDSDRLDAGGLLGKARRIFAQQSVMRDQNSERRVHAFRSFDNDRGVADRVPYRIPFENLATFVTIAAFQLASLSEERRGGDDGGWLDSELGLSEDQRLGGLHIVADHLQADGSRIRGQGCGVRPRIVLPANRENNREFCKIGADRRLHRRKSPRYSKDLEEIPYATLTGNFQRHNREKQEP
jgi:hypothetical protein